MIKGNVDAINIIADCAMELIDEISLFKKYISKIAKRTKPRGNRKQYVHLYDEFKFYASIYSPDFVYLDISDEEKNADFKKNEVVKSLLHLLRKDKDSAAPYNSFRTFLAWMIEKHPHDAESFYSEFRPRCIEILSANSTSDRSPNLGYETFPSFQEIYSQEQNGTDAEEPILTQDETAEELTTASDKVSFEVEDWLPEQWQPRPELGERWQNFCEIVIPKKFEIAWAHFPGNKTYIPHSIIWARDQIHGIVQSKNQPGFTRLVTCSMKGGEAGFIFTEQSKKSAVQLWQYEPYKTTVQTLFLRTAQAYFLLILATVKITISIKTTGTYFIWLPI